MNLNEVIAKRSNKCVYKDGDQAVKVFEVGYSKADILNEALNLAKIEELDLNTPGVKEVTMIDGKWAIVTNFQEGKTIAELMAENPDKTAEYMEMFVELQISIHKKSAPQLNYLKDKMNRKISQSGLDASTRYELHARLEGMKKHAKVLHGDYTPSNVVVKPDGTFFVLDWAHTTQGNASADAARTYLTFKLKKQDDFAEMYLDMFCKKSDIAKQLVQKWLPIVAASQLVKGKEEEKEFLMNWANVVEYV